MNNTTRRVFFMQVAAGTSVLAATQAMALTNNELNIGDPKAVALGYVADTTNANAKKYPKHTKQQMCSNCALYAGKPKEAAGACPLFAGKQVAAKGWCSAWAKKAA